MPSLAVNGVRLEYIESGSGPQTIVFAHGFAMSSMAWREVLPMIPGNRYRACAVDLRGFGMSSRANRYGLADFAEDMYSFGCELAGDGFIFVGHSMSGLIGLKLAANHASAVKALVLVAPPPARGVKLTRAILSQLQATGLVGSDSKDEKVAWSLDIARAFLPKMFASPPPAERIEEFVAESMKMDPHAIPGCLPWIVAPGLQDLLSQLSMPTMIIGAGRDIIPAHLVGETAAAIPGCRLEVFEDSGHTLFVERPQMFAGVLMDFLDEACKSR